MAKFSSTRSIATNRKALHEYAILEKMEAGIVLKGTEVKSLREGNVNLREGYAKVDQGVVVLHNCHIGTYSHGNFMNHDPLRPRVLLLHKKEIDKVHGKVQQKGLTLVPLRIFFNSRGLAKVELALGRGKKHFDRRETEKRKEAGREIERTLKSAARKS